MQWSRPSSPKWYVIPLQWGCHSTLPPAAFLGGLLLLCPSSLLHHLHALRLPLLRMNPLSQPFWQAESQPLPLCSQGLSSVSQSVNKHLVTVDPAPLTIPSLLFIYGYTVFVASRRLSLVAAAGGCSLLWCVAFPWWWLLSEKHKPVHTDISSCVHRLSCSEALWNLPRLGTEPVSPALAGGFLSTAPPGKSNHTFFNTHCVHGSMLW